MKTRITALLGTTYPIIQGGMQWVATAELASAVSNAGGLGVLGALTQPTPEDLAREIERCRKLTSRPFGVNVTMLRSVNPPPFERIFQTIVENGVKIVETAGNVPQDIFDFLKRHGVVIVHKATSVRHAIAAQRRGVDAISIDGMECAGHPGEDDVPGLVLIPAAARALDIPLIASGGIANGQGMAAALVLGAEGINMGTRFVATQEAAVHENIKRAIVNGSERDTRLIMRPLKNSARVLANAVAAQVSEMEQRPGATFEDIRSLVAGTKGRAALESGDIDSGILWVGQVMGLIEDIPTCDTLIRRIVADCEARLAVAGRYFENRPSGDAA